MSGRWPRSGEGAAADPTVERERRAHLRLRCHESVAVSEGVEHALTKVVSEEGGGVLRSVCFVGGQVEKVEGELGVVELFDAGQKRHVETGEFERGLGKRKPRALRRWRAQCSCP